MKSNKKFLIVVVVLVITGFFTLKISTNSVSSDLRTNAVDSNLLVRSHSLVKGSKGAPVTVVEFLDPECEACRAMHPIVKRLLAEYEGKIQVVIRYMPLHGNSKFAAAALEEAREQGKFDEALDVLFERQPEWGDHANPRPDLIPEYLRAIGMDVKPLESAYLLSKYGARIEIDRQDGFDLGVKRTPTFFVNGKQLQEIGYAPIKSAIDEALTEAE